MAILKLMVSLAVVLLMKDFSTDAVSCGGVTCTADQGDCINDGTSDVCYCRPLFMGTDCTTACGACTNSEVCITDATTCGACTGGCDAIREKCATVNLAAACRCIDGLSGATCATITCSVGNPCQNGGACDTNACTCDKDHAGSICETECAGGCTNLQQCEITGGNPTCECKDGLSGTNCATITCGANNAPCENGGTCADGACTCTKNFAGTICETECAGGCTDLQQCEITGGNPTCECRDGLSGADCTTITCGTDNKSPCLNNGTCADGACTCTKNFAGTICELECPTACGDNEQCEVVDSSPQCNHGVTAVVTPALIATLLTIFVFL